MDSCIVKLCLDESDQPARYDENFFERILPHMISPYTNGEIPMKNESPEQFWKRVTTVCSFCHNHGHFYNKCPTLSSNICPVCGFKGHTARMCNKSKVCPEDHSLIGQCVFKECRRTPEKWGHWLVTCPRRMEAQGDYIFPDYINMNLVNQHVPYKYIHPPS